MTDSPDDQPEPAEQSDPAQEPTPAARPKLRRSWPQRLTITMLALGAFGALATAAGLATGQWVLSKRQFVEIAAPSTDPGSFYEPPTIMYPGATTTTIGDPTVTTTTLPLAEPDASNFLIVGSDGGDCFADDPTIGPRGGINRSDTMMVWRVNPSTNQIAVLSFPRDLYVTLSNGRTGRINESFRLGPQGMIDTIWQNFGIPINHYISVDFCAFVALVDAVGGVTIPFPTPARDRRVAFEVAAGCQTLNGIDALRYVRSRYYQWQDDNGNWHTDGTSDFGRISRQQDFIRRVIARVISDGLYKPDTLAALYETNRDYLVVDEELRLRSMQEFANVVRRVDPAEIATYRIASRGINRNGASMQEPLLGSDNMKAILAVFRGHATLESAPDQVFATTVPNAPDTSAPTGTVPETTVPNAPGVTTNVTTTAVPTVTVTVTIEGKAPDPTATC